MPTVVTSFFVYIRRFYGSYTVKLMKKFINNNKSSAKLRGQIKFLCRCKRFNILPPSLQFNFDFLGLKGHARMKVQNRFRNIVLSQKIKQSHLELRRATNLIHENTVELYNILPQDTHQDFVERLSSSHDIILESTDSNCIDKFAQLTSSARGKYLAKTFCNDNWIKNLTNVPIPDRVKSVLALGEKFCVKQQIKRNDAIDIISQTTVATENLPANIKSDIRNKTVNILTNLSNTTPKPSCTTTFFAEDLSLTRQFLNENSTLIVTRCW